MERMEEGYCPCCSGSGEGMYDGSRCNSCGGRGEATYMVDVPRPAKALFTDAMRVGTPQAQIAALKALYADHYDECDSEWDADDMHDDDAYLLECLEIDMADA